MPPEAPPIGHNSRHSLQAAAEQNVESGVLLLCKEFLVTAIQDKRLNRTHLRVLACFVELVNRKTAKAWPGRQLIADTLGLDVRNVSNVLTELRGWGYLIAERERVEEAGNRNLMVYTFGNVDHDTIRREIETYIANIKAAKFTPGGEVDNGKSPYRVNSESPQRVKRTPEGETDKPATSPHGLDSNQYTKTTTVVGASPSAQPMRAARLSEDWRLPKALGEWALEHFAMSADEVRSEAAAFKDYWTGLGNTKQAAKKDWPATWRNWIRNSRKKYRQIKPDDDVAPDLIAEPTRSAAFTDAMRQMNAIVGRPR